MALVGISQNEIRNCVLKIAGNWIWVGKECAANQKSSVLVELKIK